MKIIKDEDIKYVPKSRLQELEQEGIVKREKVNIPEWNDEEDSMSNGEFHDLINQIRNK